MSAGRAQKSPQTHRIAAPICWSAKGDNVTPRTCAYTVYQLTAVKMLIEMASTVMITFVEMTAPACQIGLRAGFMGYDSMIWSQKSTPVMKKLACIAHTWINWFRWDRSKSAGICHTNIAALNEIKATQGERTNLPSARIPRVCVLR